jgi:polyhydroxybutyrate depolymerase
MKKIIFLSLLSLTGFFISAQSGTTIIDSILSNSIYRKFRLYVPASYTSSSAVPLLFNLHGLGSNASQQQLYGNFMPIADTAKFLIVHPEGTAPFGSQYFNAGFGFGANDVLFMSDLIDSLKSIYNIDEERVYSCGMSNGGIMSYYLACMSPNRFTAIASVTGTMLNPWFSLAPGRPFPVMEIHGINDATVPYNGDATFAHIDSVVKKWAVHNQCNLTPLTYSVPDVVPGDGATAVNYRYTGGVNNADVELYKVLNGAHTWPGAPVAINVTCMDFNASAEIWRFFSKYRKNLLTNVTTHRQDAVQMTVFPNPAAEEVFVKCTKGLNPDIRITDVNGQQLKTDYIKHSEGFLISLHQIPEGFYFINISKDGKILGTKKLIKIAQE